MCSILQNFFFVKNVFSFSEILSDKEKSVRCPRLSPDGKNLFWLQRPVGGAHNGCRELIKFNLETNKVYLNGLEAVCWVWLILLTALFVPERSFD